MARASDAGHDAPLGYAGAILRVDLTSGRISREPFDEAFARTWIGGIGIGSKVLYEEIGPEIGWDHPENRLVLATGPLAGTPVWGTGGLTVATRGAMTGGATSTHANGFFGANLKSQGFDAIIVQGRSERWVALHIHDGRAELRDATPLLGKDTWETQDALHAETGLQGHALSVYSIGPAGEKLVRFAAIQGDYGHVASKNGCGAVMGSKRLKAVVIARGSRGFRVADPSALFGSADEISHDLRTNLASRNLYEMGTLGGVVGLLPLGALPIKNLTTSLAPPEADLSQWEPMALRNAFDHRGHQCNACGMRHCHMQVVRDGEHRGEIIDEPEYEGWVGSGWAFGATDPVAVSWMNTQCDRACVDVNEFGWLIGWVMECYEKGWLTREQLGGIEARWGDVKAADALLQLLCRREGFGDVLAEGVMRASQHLGGPAADCAVYTRKGSSPRGHDHRTMWEEMLDTCTSSTSTIESAWAVRPLELGLPAAINLQDPDAVPKRVAGLLGRRHFEDSLGACVFTTATTVENLAMALGSVTGWSYSLEEAIRFGRRTAVLLRAFNLRCGIGPELEYPSERYGSIPQDGPTAGVASRPHWEHMLDVWYEQVGYDRKSGKPLPELLDRLDLPQVKADLWGS